MKFESKKYNFITYLILFILGVSLVIASALLKNKCEVWPDIMMGLGCSTIPTAIAGYLIDKINNKNVINRFKAVRKFSLWALPFGVFEMAKNVVESYCDTKNIKISFKSAFDCAIDFMNNKGKNDFNMNIDECKVFLKRLDYAFNICIKDSKIILDNKLQLLMDNIFLNKNLL